MLLTLYQTMVSESSMDTAQELTLALASNTMTVTQARIPTLQTLSSMLTTKISLPTKLAETESSVETSAP